MRPCISITYSIRGCVRQSVGPSVTTIFKTVNLTDTSLAIIQDGCIEVSNATFFLLLVLFHVLILFLTGRTIVCPELVYQHTLFGLRLNLLKQGPTTVATSCPKASNGQRLPCPALLSSWFSWGRQGSSPNRGRSPVEWGDFPSVRSFVRPFPPLGHPARPEAQPARPEAHPAMREA